MRFGVAMIASIFYPSIGGAQTHTLRLSQKLRARGVDALVVTRHHQGLARYEEIDGVPTYRVGRGDAGKAVAALSYIQGALQVLHAQRQRYHILHCHQMVSPTTIGLLARPLLRKPLVINPHARGPIGDVAKLTTQRPLTGRVRLAAMRRWGSAFVSISDDIGDELRGVGVAPEKLWNIPNGVDLDHFAPSDPHERVALRESFGLPKGPLAIFTGRLARVKGLDVLLTAWARVLRELPEARLLLVGEGEERAALERQAGELGLSDAVIFYGGSADVAPLLRAADSFVLCSRTEGLPISLLEAMAACLPVVATRVGGMAQVLEDGITGRLVPVEGVAELARGLCEALSDQAARDWGRRAREQVAAQYSLDAVAERYISMYEALLQSGGAGALEPDRMPRV